MKRLLHIIFLVVLAVACTPELKDTGLQSADLEGKVLIDFSVQIPNVAPSTKAMAEKPALENLMVAVFDTEGYLVEHTFASEGTQYAIENGVEYIYKVALTQSKDRRIIHFIGNAPKSLRFGTEETVLSYVKSELGSDNEDLYWYRRVVPSISGTNQTLEPIYQATDETKAAFDNIPLIRNFARISLVNAATSDFELESWTVVNTYKTGTCAAYNTTKGEFVEYFNYVDNLDPTLQQLDIKELDDPKTLETLLGENYKGNVPANVEKVSVAEAKSKLSSAQYYYAYERDVTTDPAYIIAYGTYKADGKNKKCYYKIGLYDNDGKSFPLLRNFQYTLTITKVERPGYETFEEASTSTGSGNISTAQETLSLVYISDGVASLSVDYIEKMIVEVPKDGVDLGFKFISDVEKGTVGSLSNVRVIVNKPEGTAGAAIAKVNGTAVAAGDKIEPNDWTLKITPVTPTAASKKQSITIYADYTRGEGAAAQTITLQRTVTYIVWEKQSLVVKCVPNEIPQERGSNMDLQVTLPGGLSSSMFPLYLKIEAANLSITPNNERDHMPVQTGLSVIPDKNGKSAFYFIKTVQWAEYQASKLVTCYFKSNKDQSDSYVYVANDYFNTAKDEFTTYVASHFDQLRFSDDPVPCVEDVPVNFSFTMDGKWNQEVKVYLDGLQPHEDDPNGLVPVIVDGAIDHYVFTPTSENGGEEVTLKLQTTDESSPLYVGLESNRYAYAYETADRDWMEFTNLSISPNRLLQGVGRSASISFRMDASDADYASRDVTVTLDGLAFADGKDVFTFKPVTSGNVTVTQNYYGTTVTITGLKTMTATETVWFTVSAPGYEETSASRTRSRGTFSDLSFRQNGSTVTSLPTSSEEVDFNFTLSDYDEDMAITVTLEGFEPVDGTKASEAYIYQPSGTNCTIKLRTAKVSSQTQCKVTLSEPYFTEASASITQKDVIVIPDGNLVVNFNRNTRSTFANGGTINIYTARTGGTLVTSYKYTRGNSNRRATNKADIELSGVTEDTTLYVRYTTNGTTYYASFKVSDAIDNNGVTLTLQAN